MFLICQVTSLRPLVERSSEFMDESSSRCFTILITIRRCYNGGIMFLICHVTPADHILKELWEFMGGSNSQ